MNARNYWGYRIDKANIRFIQEELMQGRLRQGWGYRKEQDLRNPTIDEGAFRNLVMFNSVKKNDILLVPELPGIGFVSIVEASEDWDIGYRFEIPENKGAEDVGYLGHIFPVSYRISFSRYDERSEERTIRECLRDRNRFWSIYQRDCQEAIDRLLNR